MRFTLKALLPPLAIWAAYSFFLRQRTGPPPWLLWHTLIMVWLYAAIAVVAIYWLARLASRYESTGRHRR